MVASVSKLVVKGRDSFGSLFSAEGFRGLLGGCSGKTCEGSTIRLGLRPDTSILRKERKHTERVAELVEEHAGRFSGPVI